MDNSLNFQQNRTIPIFYLFIVLALIFRCAAVWYGFDRAPLFITNDEVIFNDPAVALSQGKGFVAESYSHMNLNKYYSHFPPLFPIVQSFIIKALGLSPFSIRGMSVICYALNGVLFLLLLWNLRRINVLDNFGYLFAALLFLLEPTDFAMSRLGRPETFCVLLMLLAFVIIFWSWPKRNIKKWLISSTIIGLAISTHLSMIIGYVFFVIIALALERKNLKFQLLIWLIPPCVFVLLWFVVHRENAVKAFFQFITFFKCQPDSIAPGFNWVVYVKSVFGGGLGYFKRFGGFSKLLILIAELGALIRLISENRLNNETRPMWRKSLLVAFILMSGTYLLMEITLGTATQRTLIVLPMAVITIGLSVSWLNFSHSFKKYLVSYFLMGCLFVELMMSIFYLNLTREQWVKRDPNRLFDVISAIPQGSHVTARPVFWYPLKKRNYKVEMVATGVPCEENAFQTINFATTDYIIVYQNDPVHPTPKENWRKLLFRDGIANYDVYKKEL